MSTETVEIKENEKKSKKSLIVIILLLLLILILAGVSVWAIFFRDRGGAVLAPDYAPIQQDSNATDIEGDSTDKLEAPDGGGAVGITYSDKVVINLSDKTVSMLFQNPGRSLNNMVLMIFAQDELLFQSDLLTPGKQILSIPLEKKVLSKLQPGGYDGKFVVAFYDPDTGEKAMIDSAIKISNEVKE